MSVRKYRIYLFMVVLVVAIVGAVSYFYYQEQEKTYRDGTLVRKEYVIEEGLA